VSSSPDGTGLAAYVRTAFDVLRRECPAAFLGVCRRLSPRTVAVEVDGEAVLLAFRPETVDVVSFLDHTDVRLSTTSEAILSVLNAESTLEEAVWRDAIVLRGTAEDLAHFHDALLDYIRGAVRCPSFPGRDDFRAMTTRSHPVPETSSTGGPAVAAARTRPAWRGPRARTSANTAAVLSRKHPGAPMSAGDLIVLDPSACPGGRLTAAWVIDYLDIRLPLLPRLRQRLAHVPLEAGRPVWVDDEAFDLRYHVRPAVLPAPGSSRELVDLVEQVYREPLNRARPLWELYVVEGLADRRVALVLKHHQAIADGAGSAAMSLAMFDGDRPVPRQPAGARPPLAPSELDLLRDALGEHLELPSRAAAALRSLLVRPRQARERSSTVLRGLLALAAARPLEPSPLNAPVGPDRRYSMAELPWRAVRAVARDAGCGVGDVLLTSLAAALGKLLERRGLGSRGRVQRVLAPLSRHGQDERMRLGDDALFVIDLPVGPMDEADRLACVAAATSTARASGQDAAVDLLLRVSEWAPPPWHALAPALRRGPDLVNLMVSSLAGPRRAPTFAGARQLACYPIPAVMDRLALTVAFASLDGTLGIGMMADSAAVPDVDQVAGDLRAAFVALQEGTRPGHGGAEDGLSDEWQG
jgi:diacylglycerol O-acyltransferase